jgi:hypothetical protein
MWHQPFLASGIRFSKDLRSGESIYLHEKWIGGGPRNFCVISPIGFSSRPQAWPLSKLPNVSASQREQGSPLCRQ